MKLRLKSRLKTIKAHKLVEDFNEEAPDDTLASVLNIVVMLISFLFREEAILKLRTNLRMRLKRFMGLGFTSIKKIKLHLWCVRIWVCTFQQLLRHNQYQWQAFIKIPKWIIKAVDDNINNERYPQPLFQCAKCENVFAVIGTYKSI